MILGEVLGLTGYPSARHRSEEGLFVAEELVRIVERCTAPDPGDRFQVVEHFVEALELARRGESRLAKSDTVREQENHWRHVRRCLHDNRTQDARRLCQILLKGCPHHAGARAVIANLDRQRLQGVSAARALSSEIDNLLLIEAFNKLRAIVALTPDDQTVIDLVEGMETRVGASKEALLEAFSHLTMGDLDAALGAFEQAAAYDAESASAQEACVLVGDLRQSLRISQRRIDVAIGKKQYGIALQLTETHQRRLAATAAHALGLRAGLVACNQGKKASVS